VKKSNKHVSFLSACSFGVVRALSSRVVGRNGFSPVFLFLMIESFI